MNPSNVAIVAQLLENDLPKVADVVVDKGVDYVQDKLGVELHANLSPEQIEQLKDATMAHEEFMAKLDEASRQRATDMQKEALNSQDPIVRHFIYYFAWFWSGVSVLYFFTVTLVPFKENSPNQHFADIILGFLLGTAVASIIQFFYGSSKSSQDKTHMLNAKESQQ